MFDPETAIIQTKVTLEDIAPPIWRQLLLPPTLNLAELHHVIQAAFGWLDCHLHQFVVGGLRYGAPELLEQDFEDNSQVFEATLIGLRDFEWSYTQPMRSVACGAMREGISIEVSAADRDRLERIVADRNSPQKHVWRARIILATAAGCGTAEIMRRAEVSKPCVWRWQERFMREGVAGLVRDKTRKPGLPPLPPAVVDRVVALTLGDPPGETTHWTGRAMAAASGVSLRSVQRIWAAHGLQPHRVRRFKLSTDPAFAAKLRDVVGLYLDPPAHSLVLSVDEKSVDGPRLAREKLACGIIGCFAVMCPASHEGRSVNSQYSTEAARRPTASARCPKRSKAEPITAGCPPTSHPAGDFPTRSRLRDGAAPRGWRQSVDGRTIMLARPDNGEHPLGCPWSAPHGGRPGPRRTNGERYGSRSSGTGQTAAFNDASSGSTPWVA